MGGLGGIRPEGPGLHDDDVDMYRAMTATQDSFRRQLADMRDNLNKVSDMRGMSDA